MNLLKALTGTWMGLTRLAAALWDRLSTGCQHLAPQLYWDLTTPWLQGNNGFLLIFAQREKRRTAFSALHGSHLSNLLISIDRITCSEAAQRALAGNWCVVCVSEHFKNYWVGTIITLLSVSVMQLKCIWNGATRLCKIPSSPFGTWACAITQMSSALSLIQRWSQHITSRCNFLKCDSAFIHSRKTHAQDHISAVFPLGS